MFQRLINNGSTNRTSRRKLGRLSIGLHIACAALTLWLLHLGRTKMLAPVVAKQRIARQRADQLNELLRSATEITEQNSELVTSLRDIRQRETEARQRVPEESREDEVLEKVTVKAGQRGVAVKDYRRKGVISRNGYNELGITISCSGKFHSICELLHDLTSFSRVVHVKQLKLSRANEEQICDLSLELALYFGAVKPATKEDGKSAKTEDRFSLKLSEAKRS